MLAIAHRLSTIAELDRLVVVEVENKVEEGTHNELLARQGLYFRLWNLQSGGFLATEMPKEFSKGFRLRNLLVLIVLPVAGTCPACLQPLIYPQHKKAQMRNLSTWRINLSYIPKQTTLVPGPA